MIEVSAATVRSFRLRANGLERRRPRNEIAEAAFAGFQDSSPRAGLLALHARVEDVRPGDWEHPALVQTWAPRGAVFIVAARDLGVFARGFIPRDRQRQEALDRAAAEARAAATGEADLAVVGRMGRLAAAAAGLPLRWDTRTTTVLPAPPPTIDDEVARRELARRFLRSLGPSGPRHFSRWAGVEPADARETFTALREAGELIGARIEGHRGGVLLATDEQALRTATPVLGAYLLPHGADPLLQSAEPAITSVRERSGRVEVDVRGDWRRLPRTALGGIAVLDEQVVAAFGRAGGKVTLLPLRRLADDQRDAVDTAAHALAPVLGQPVSTTWLPQET